MKLQEAFQAHDDGKIDFAQLQAEQDKAAEDSIKRLEETGETYVTDEKPKHGSPDFARDIAMQKIANRVQGAKMASEELGV
jgi:hypothetical protein